MCLSAFVWRPNLVDQLTERLHQDKPTWPTAKGKQISSEAFQRAQPDPPSPGIVRFSWFEHHTRAMRNYSSSSICPSYHKFLWENFLTTTLSLFTREMQYLEEKCGNICALMFSFKTRSKCSSKDLVVYLYNNIDGNEIFRLEFKQYIVYRKMCRSIGYLF